MRAPLAAVILGVVVTASIGSHTQTLNPTPQQVINEPRALTAPEVAVILDASRHAADGKSFRIGYTPEGPGVEVRMAADGWPRIKRERHGGDFVASGVASRGGWQSTAPRRGHVDVTTITEYTSAPATSCRGEAMNGKLVVEYEFTSATKTWTAKARPRPSHETLAMMFDILAGNVAAASGELGQINRRPARAFIAPYSMAEGAIASDALRHANEMLWIDRETLLPLRVALALRPSAETNTPAIPDYGLWFTADASIDIQPPNGVSAPECIN
jgi:hypothetical protein